MKRTTWLLPPVIAVLLCGPVVACPTSFAPVTRTVVSTAAAKAVVVATDAVIVPIATFVPVPLYTASYTPTPTAPAPAPPTVNPDLKAVLDALKSLDTRLRAIEGKAAAAPAPKVGAAARADAAPLSALSIFSSKCAACHDKAVASDKGGGLVLLDAGKIAELTDRQARKVLSASYAGRMPPKSSGVSLTDEEVATIATYLDSLK